MKDLNSKISYHIQDNDDGTLTLIGEGGPKFISVFCLDEKTTHRFDITYEHTAAGVISFESTWVNFKAAKERIMEKRRKAVEEKRARKAAEEAEAAVKRETERQLAAMEKAKQDLIEAEKEKARLEKEAADREAMKKAAEEEAERAREAAVLETVDTSRVDETDQEEIIKAT